MLFRDETNFFSNKLSLLQIYLRATICILHRVTFELEIRVRNEMRISLLFAYQGDKGHNLLFPGVKLC